MHMLQKIGTVCIKVTDPHSNFDCICIRTLRTNTPRLLTADLAPALKQVQSLCIIPIILTLLSGGEIQSNSTYGSTIDPSKQWVIVINVIIIRVNNFPPPPLCTTYHERIVCVIYHLFRKIILEAWTPFHWRYQNINAEISNGVPV